MTDKIPEGYYIKARIIKNKPISKAPPHIREIWDYFLREANHKDKKYGKHDIKRGQLFRSFKDIKEDLCWFAGWRKITYNENHMKTAMKYLKKHLMITSTKHPGGMLITVLNYSVYQDPKSYETTKELTNETTKGTPVDNLEGSHNNKNVKNEKNAKNKKTTKKSRETISPLDDKQGFIDQLPESITKNYEMSFVLSVLDDLIDYCLSHNKLNYYTDYNATLRGFIKRDLKDNKSSPHQDIGKNDINQYNPDAQQPVARQG